MVMTSVEMLILDDPELVALAVAFVELRFAVEDGTGYRVLLNRVLET